MAQTVWVMMDSVITGNEMTVTWMDEYIEREAAYEDFEKCNSENPKWTPSRVKALIARQKAADAVPVRHGRWFVNGYVCGETEYQCSECKETEWRTSSSRLKFCPFCGAKMDLEV